ncbi:hypothetical protein ACQP1K_28175 [Sphaerimonospora sp. CA-214678]|uniref:hypothetical protein n=1 Tax=Sphaerimonospora sp. CA-214678 TaxID=3240029 RepID=UPI003D8AFDD4
MTTATADSEGSELTVRARAEEQVAVALEYVQGKRRIERVIEAADALLTRYAGEPDTRRRLEMFFELVRRNFSQEISVEFDGSVFRTQERAQVADAVDCVFQIECPDGRHGVIAARYAPPGTLGLTAAEWRAAMGLLARIAGLGAGGHARCVR